jgi:hypothetical protein
VYVVIAAKSGAESTLPCLADTSVVLALSTTTTTSAIVAASSVTTASSSPSAHVARERKSLFADVTIGLLAFADITIGLQSLTFADVMIGLMSVLSTNVERNVQSLG